MNNTLSKFLDHLSSTEHVNLSKVQVKHTPDAGYGLFATEDFSADIAEPMVTIPSNLIVTASKALQYLKEHNRQQYNELKELPKNNKTIERYCILLFLICEKNAATPSSWRYYIDILPTLDTLKSSQAFFYQDEEMQFLEGTSLHKSIMERRSNVSKLLKQLTALVPSASNVSLDDWQWADMVFWTRVVSIDSQKQSKDKDSSEITPDYAMVPLLDFANHSLAPNLRWELDSEGNFQLLAHSEGGSAGEQLYFSYGDKPNQELLFLHGFCIPDNPNPAKFTMSVIPLMMMDEDTIEPKMRWLQDIGETHTLTLEKNPQGDEHPLMKAGITKHSAALLQLAVLDVDDPIDFILEDDNLVLCFEGKPQASLDDLLESVSRYELCPIQHLRASLLLSQALGDHYEKIAETTEEMKSASHSDNSVIQNILIYALEELALLENALSILQDVQSDLGKDPRVLQYIADSQSAE
ncbi:hypothetical protein K450DRAFT_235646 [Umbelopsis ramanniana AG]|uniref:SET domain-containing protein n=1 Tax=Umbelopsis ramanniana AG TaxID=1314678 RepID=A0AAD5EB55_UMBRA|nr:uncharacterized protein K450DRAFT_235646 [Umbelopsis ramanniana AG]KAI8580723.1 hypothetical protein K450DRAFT_235646 [Umbelopsis ramanniana AG]